MIFPKRRLAALAPAVAALAIAAPATVATAASSDPAPVVSGPSCPDGYSGPTNLATGCPYYTMSFTVKYPGQPAFRCPANWNAPDSGLEACRHAPPER